MGEIGGLVALGMIGFVVIIVAWLNCGSCKLGRHDWSPWTQSQKSNTYSYNLSGYPHYQDRVCKKCNKEKRRYFIK
jgi:hypothetical protein